MRRHKTEPPEGARGRDRLVSMREDGCWENKRVDASRATSLHDSEAEAIVAAHRSLEAQGGGKIFVMRDGRVQITKIVEDNKP